MTDARRWRNAVAVMACLVAAGCSGENSGLPEGWTESTVRQVRETGAHNQLWRQHREHGAEGFVGVEPAAGGATVVVGMDTQGGCARPTNGGQRMRGDTLDVLVFIDKPQPMNCPQVVTFETFEVSVTGVPAGTRPVRVFAAKTGDAEPSLLHRCPPRPLAQG